MLQQQIAIPTDTTTLSALLTLPERPTGVIVWVHGAYAGPDHDLQHAVAGALAADGLAVVNVELSSGIDGTHHVDDAMRRHAMHVFAQRLMTTTDRLRALRATSSLPIGYFGVGVGAGAACAAAVARPREVSGLVTWEGRFDLVGRDILASLRSPLLMLVSEQSPELLSDTRMACAHLGGPHQLKVVSKADASWAVSSEAVQVARYARVWFDEFLRAESSRPLSMGRN